MRTPHAPRPLALVRFRAAALALALAACSGDGDIEEEAPLPATPVEVEPLTEADMMGVPMSEVVLNLPWSGSPLSRDPAPDAPRAALASVEVSAGERFDRALFEFGTDAPFPGYRVAWADSAMTACGEDAPAPDGSARAVVVRIEPATGVGEDGLPRVTERSLRPDLPAVAAARQLCDEGGLVVWAFEVEDSTTFRVIELQGPPRLMVDVRHPGAAAPTAPDGAAPGDSASGAEPRR